MSLTSDVKIAGRFLRSVRIDTDLDDENSLDGFICPQSSADVLMSMARHIESTGQGAFTWTGPYGSGKSSLVIALAALVSGNLKLRKKASTLFGSKLTKAMHRAMPCGDNGWKILPVVARRDDPVLVIGGAAEQAGLCKKPKQGWTETTLLSRLLQEAQNAKDKTGGLVLFIDEMGKFLEAAAGDGSDIYILQQLAEAASRSDGRLIIIGVLHQSFDEYASRLSRDVRDEWAKVQGRFVDLAVNIAGAEQIDLISRAILSDEPPKGFDKIASGVANRSMLKLSQKSDGLAKRLTQCWPLHPVVASLLGPVSRRRFGQNQRSIFGFLNSAELFGFQDFLKQATRKSLFTPDLFWDYLRANLEPSIMASPDSHRWALAVDAIERCESNGGDTFRVKLLKTIAMIDLFKERSGLLPDYELLRICFPKTPAKELKKVLANLQSDSFVIFKKYQEAYAIFAGSDFDIETATRNALSAQPAVDYARLRDLIGLQPILAKRHYHETGALRWFDVDIVQSSNLVETVSNGTTQSGAIGRFLLAVPATRGSVEDTEKLCRKTARINDNGDVIIGTSKSAVAINELARELSALEHVKDNHPELAGDAVARREVITRLGTVQALFETAVQQAFDSAIWYRKGQKPAQYRQHDLNSLASQLANERYPQSPIIFNELLNRSKPSGTAVSAQKSLMRKMILNAGSERLGISGYPAEGGLYASVLEATGLYGETAKGFKLCSPEDLSADTANLKPLWGAASNYLEKNSDRPVNIGEVFDVWNSPPYGVKPGLMPILAIAFLITTKDTLAIYHDGLFQTSFSGLDVDYLVKNPETIQVRWMSMSEEALNMLSGMGHLVRDHRSEEQELLTPIDVARGLVAIHDGLPDWTKRTNRLSANALRIREILKRAKDPNALIFDDLPDALSKDVDSGQNVVERLGDGLNELVSAYPTMLDRLQGLMLEELQVPNVSEQSLLELHERLSNARNLAGDFNLEAFVGRLSTFDGSAERFESVASLAISKPPRTWVDPDLDRAAIEIADLSQRFLRAETFARVKGRKQTRQAMAVMVGQDGAPVPVIAEFAVNKQDREQVDAMVKVLKLALDECSEGKSSLVLAALAEVSLKYMGETDVVVAAE